jgi:hypothetical protein
LQHNRGKSGRDCSWTSRDQRELDEDLDRIQPGGHHALHKLSRLLNRKTLSENVLPPQTKTLIINHGRVRGMKKACAPGGAIPNTSRLRNWRGRSITLSTTSRSARSTGSRSSRPTKPQCRRRRRTATDQASRCGTLRPWVYSWQLAVAGALPKGNPDAQAAITQSAHITQRTSLRGRHSLALIAMPQLSAGHSPAPSRQKVSAPVCANQYPAGKRARP